MGCDIHLYVERRDGDTWKYFGPPLIGFAEEEGPDFPGRLFTDYEEWDKEWEATRNNPMFYSGRNYDLFAILANVRNGYGFAGTPTGSGFNPIDMPRGVPDDASSEYKYVVAQWEADGHSHSYLTLQEILDFDWDRGTTHTALVTAEDYITFKENGVPEYCFGGSNSPTVSNEEMERLIASGEASSEVCTRVTWKETYADCCRHFLTETVPSLLSLGDPKDTRLVFFFDN